MSPAIDWLCNVWHSLTGTSPPPKSAALLLADDLAEWTTDSPVEDPCLLRLWTRLQIAVIGSIWHTRCARDQGTLRHLSPARFAITHAVNMLNAAIQRDWTRTMTDLRTLDNGCFCTSWWRGLDPSLPMERFLATWTYKDILCSVEFPEENGDRDSTVYSDNLPILELKLRIDQPLPFPA